MAEAPVQTNPTACWLPSKCAAFKLCSEMIPGCSTCAWQKCNTYPRCWFAAQPQWGLVCTACNKPFRLQQNATAQCAL